MLHHRDRFALLSEFLLQLLKEPAQTVQVDVDRDKLREQLIVLIGDASFAACFDPARVAFSERVPASYPLRSLILLC